MYRQKRGGANGATSNQPYVQAEERGGANGATSNQPYVQAEERRS